MEADSVAGKNWLRQSLKLKSNLELKKKS